MKQELLNRHEAEKYVYEFTGLDIAELGGLAEEKYTKHELNQLITDLVKQHELNQLVTDLVKHKEDKHEK